MALGTDAGVTNCCTAQATCANAKCSSSTVQNASVRATKCTGAASTCLEATCCRATKCSESYLGVKCGAGKYLDTAKAAMVLGTDAGVTNCCTPMATCASADCGTGKKVNTSAASLKCTNSSGSCVQATCCENTTAPKATCADAQCQRIFEQVNTSAASMKCVGDAASCVLATCCEKIASNKTVKAPTIVIGKIRFEVELPANVTAASFVKDAGVKKGVEKGIAKKLGVLAEWVNATLTLGNRRLAETRHLAGGFRSQASASIQVDFVVTVPATAPQLASAIQTSLYQSESRFTLADKKDWSTQLATAIKEEATAYKDIKVEVSSVAHVPNPSTQNPGGSVGIASDSTRSCIAGIFMLACMALQA